MKKKQELPNPQWTLASSLLSNFISLHFIARDPIARQKMQHTNQWTWMRCGRKICVALTNKEYEIIGLGWAECSKTDRFNPEIGLRIAIARALR